MLCVVGGGRVASLGSFDQAPNAESGDDVVAYCTVLYCTAQHRHDLKRRTPRGLVRRSEVGGAVGEDD